MAALFAAALAACATLSEAGAIKKNIDCPKFVVAFEFFIVHIVGNTPSALHNENYAVVNLVVPYV